MKQANGARWVAVTAVIFGLIAGCSTPPRPKPTPASPSSAPTDPATATRQAILTGYAGMWSDLEKDALTSNFQNPTLVHHATGKALLNLDENLAVDSRLGLIGKGHAVLHPLVVSMDPEQNPTSASVADCADLRNFQKYVASTGALESNAPGGMHFVTATLLKENGLWKVSELTINEVGSCGNS